MKERDLDSLYSHYSLITAETTLLWSDSVNQDESVILIQPDEVAQPPLSSSRHSDPTTTLPSTIDFSFISFSYYFLLLIVSI